MLISLILFFPKLLFKIFLFLITSKIFLLGCFIYCIACYLAVKKVISATKKYQVLKGDNPEIHEKYHMFKRLETHLWQENKLLLGAIFLSWIKITGVIASLFFCFLGLKFFVKKTDNKNNPKVKRIIDFFTMNGARSLVFFLGVFIEHKQLKDFSYEKYLGETITENKVKTEENQVEEIIPSIHISNHTSWLEILIFMSLIGTGFLAKIDVKQYPFIGLIAECLGCVFVDRDNKNTLCDTLGQVIQKQKDISSKNDLSKFMIFPEGTTSNNTGIIDFKRGAFAAELPVKPYVIKFETQKKISLAMDVIEMLYHLFMIVCVPVHFVEVIEMPVFVPNENLFKDPNKERWLQYAEAVKDAMCEASGLKKLSGSYKEKKEYLEFLRDKQRGKLN